MIDKHAVPTKILWVDLEMTGLDAQNDVILEVAAEITEEQQPLLEITRQDFRRA